MAALTFSSTATLAVNGITPGAGPTSTLKVNATFSGAATQADDSLDATYTINANTPATVIDLSKIISGKALWVEVDGPVLLTLEQDLGAGPVDITLKVDDFIFLNSGYTALKVANPSATTAVHLSVIVVGDRAPVGGGPGVF